MSNPDNCDVDLLDMNQPVEPVGFYTRSYPNSPAYLAAEPPKIYSTCQPVYTRAQVNFIARENVSLAISRGFALAGYVILLQAVFQGMMWQTYESTALFLSTLGFLFGALVLLILSKVLSAYVNCSVDIERGGIIKYDCSTHHRLSLTSENTDENRTSV
jgi:hypothetical protein